MKRAATYAVPLAAVAAAGFDEPAEAGDLFLKLENIDGESVIEGHENEIDVLAWSWGATNSGDVVQGPGKVAFSDLKIIKGYDVASPTLLLAVAAGTPIQQAVLSVNRVDGGTGQLYEYLKVTMDNVLITKVATGSKEQDNGVAETLTLDFAKVKFEYRLTLGSVFMT